MRIIFKQLIRFIFFLLLLFSLFIMIKPGASIFYFKLHVNRNKIFKDIGYSYRYDAADYLETQSYPILFYQNDQPLRNSKIKDVVDLGDGRFALEKSKKENVKIYFSTFQNSDAVLPDNEFTIYLHYSFISRRNGLLIFALLLLVPFIIEVSRFLTRKGAAEDYYPKNVGISTSVKTLGSFLKDYRNWMVLHFYKEGELSPLRQIFQRLFSISILSIYFYILMEWIFFVTKPSFMDFMRFTDKLFILLVSGLGVSIILLIIIGILSGVNVILYRLGITDLLLDFMPAIPATILAGISLILIDNFTYTVFKYGIVSTTTVMARLAYALLFSFLFIYFYIQIGSKLFLKDKNKSRELIPGQFYLSIGLLVISAFFALANFNELKQSFSVGIESITSVTNRPNIILLGGDGINASNLSVYGYERETTPHLDKLAQTSLVAENNFTNAGNSTGSDISLLTGKPPLQTRVLYPPNILKGKDVYQHLPAILKKLGYYSVEFGVEEYVDANSQNLQNGFDIVNGVNTVSNPVIGSVTNYWFNDSVYFLSKLDDRLGARLLHIFLIKDMQNPYKAVMQTNVVTGDRSKIDGLFAVLDHSQKPIFAHLHLLGTHGGKFNPAKQVFSQGEVQSDEWMTDFYDDAILEFDSYVGEVIEHLKKTGKFENTILIVYSDHGQGYEVTQRLPLVIHFPEDKYAFRIPSNSQNLDITPTILNYLGIEIPSWMEGISLLRKDIDPHRLILSATTLKAENIGYGTWMLNETNLKPPFYQFSTITVIDCQTWYAFNTNDYSWRSGEIKGHTAPCASADDMHAIEQDLLEELSAKGFEISVMK